MKKILIIIIFAAAALLNISCEETVNPKAEFRPQFILTCIVNLSSDSVMAVISRTYDVDGLNPAVNKVDPAVAGAEVSITQGTMTYRLQEGTKERSDTSRYKNFQQFYYVAGVKFTGEKDLKITAKLASGQVLSAVTTPPGIPVIKFSYEFPNGFNPNVNWYIAGDYYTIKWEITDENHFVFPRLMLPYKREVSNKFLSFAKEFPLSYIKQGDKFVPFYPSYVQADSCSFEYKTIKNIIENLQKDDPNATFVINKLQLDLIEFDTPLSSYYSSTKGVMDNFSIRTEENVYSNINGGLGIFGSYRKTSVVKPLEAYYVTGLGYLINENMR